jgi:hypothetical protein
VIRTLVRSLAGGLLGGVAVAAVGVLIGAVRAALLLASEAKIAPLSDTDAHFLVNYATAFAAAGGVVGLFWPWIRTKLVRHAAFYLAGTVFIVMLLRAEGESVMDGGVVYAILLPALGVIAGLCGVYYFEREFPRQAGVDPTARAVKPPSQAS